MGCDIGFVIQRCDKRDVKYRLVIKGCNKRV